MSLEKFLTVIQFKFVNHNCDNNHTIFSEIHNSYNHRVKAYSHL